MPAKNPNTVHTCNEINGFLTAFSLLNTSANEGYSFYIEELPSVGHVEDDLNSYYNTLFETNDQVKHSHFSTLKMLDLSFQTICLLIFERWMITGGKELRFKKENIQLCMDKFINYLQQLEIKIAYEVFVTPPDNVFYECSWQDFALTSKNKTYLLHFGISD